MNKPLMNMICAAALAAMAAIPGMCCTYSVSVPAIGAGGGVIAVAVATQAECSWSLTHTQAWMSAYGAQSGVGSGYVYLYVSPDRGAERSQAIHVTALIPGNCNIGTRSGCLSGNAVVATTTAVQY